MLTFFMNHHQLINGIILYLQNEPILQSFLAVSRFGGKKNTSSFVEFLYIALQKVIKNEEKSHHLQYRFHACRWNLVSPIGRAWKGKESVIKLI